MPEPRVHITVDGQVALTVDQAAQRLGVATNTLSGELTRYKAVIQPVAALDGKKKLYLQSDIDMWWASRPGKAWRKRPETSTGEA